MLPRWQRRPAATLGICCNARLTFLAVPHDHQLPELIARVRFSSPAPCGQTRPDQRICPITADQGIFARFVQAMVISRYCPAFATGFPSSLMRAFPQGAA